MAKTAKRTKQKPAPKRLVLTGTERVERDMRAALKREKRVARLQGQLRRALVKNRERLNVLIAFLDSEGFLSKERPAAQQPGLL